MDHEKPEAVFPQQFFPNGVFVYENEISHSVTPDGSSASEMAPEIDNVKPGGESLWYVTQGFECEGC